MGDETPYVLCGEDMYYSLSCSAVLSIAPNSEGFPRADMGGNGSKAPPLAVKEDLRGKHYIVTGSNTGIGYPIARELAKMGDQGDQGIQG